MPLRFGIAVIISLAEVCAVIGGIVALCIFVPYFYWATVVMQIGCVISIVVRNDNPEYKVPWLIVVLIVHVVG